MGIDSGSQTRSSDGSYGWYESPELASWHIQRRGDRPHQREFDPRGPLAADESRLYVDWQGAVGIVDVKPPW
jgi:hypothetical protein